MKRVLTYAILVPALPLVALCWLVTPLPDHSPVGAAVWSWTWAVLIIVIWEATK